MEHNLTLSNTEIRTIAIKARSSGTGQSIGHAPGNEFVVRNSDPEAIVATIVTNAAGNPALRLQPIVDEADGIEIDVFDTVGSASIELTVSIVARNFGAELELDMDNSTTEQQGQPGQEPVRPTPGEPETQPVGSNAPIDPGVAVGGPAVVGPAKAQPGAPIQPGVSRQEPAGAVSEEEAEKERIAREEAAGGGKAA